MKINPYDLHPESPEVKRQGDKMLLLEDLRKTIDYIIEDLETSPVPIWGYSRARTKGMLQKIFEDLEKKCL
jgi:hypothetical protein